MAFSASRKRPTLGEICLGLQSPDHDIRGRATADLLFRPTKKEAIRRDGAD